MKDYIFLDEVIQGLEFPVEGCMAFKCVEELINGHWVYPVNVVTAENAHLYRLPKDALARMPFVYPKMTCTFCTNTTTSREGWKFLNGIGICPTCLEKL